MDRACRMPGCGYAAASLGETDHTADLGRIHVPTLVVVGEHDRVCPPASTVPSVSRCPTPVTCPIRNARRYSTGSWVTGWRGFRSDPAPTAGGSGALRPLLGAVAGDVVQHSLHVMRSDRRVHDEQSEGVQAVHGLEAEECRAL